MKVVSVSNDLRPDIGCPSLDDSTFGRIFRLGQLRYVAQLEQVNHCLRQTVWQVLKSGVWLPGTLYRAGLRLTLGQNAGLREEGEKATTPDGKRHHPLVAFCGHTRKFYRPGCEAGVLTQQWYW